MYLTIKNLQERISSGEEIIQNADADNFGEVGYDVRIEKIIIVSGDELENKEECNKYDLPAGDTVFVSTMEDLKMPLDLVGIVVQRNSIIRQGLKVDAPVYQPGHHTKMFLRVTNISKNDIELKTSQSIASIMFEELSGDVKPYVGTYVNEFDYKGVGDFTKNIPKAVKLNEKMESIENIEKRLYEKVVALLTVFVGIFSLFNLNIQFLNSTADITKMLIYNLISIGGLGLLVSFIGFIIYKKHKTNWLILIISLSLIASTFWLIK